MRKFLKIGIYFTVGIAVFWTLLTFWAQYRGTKKATFLANENAQKSALIIYNPDPIYNLDEQICQSFAQELNNNDFEVLISATDLTPADIDFDLYVICTNTYNWAPDWKVTQWIKHHPEIKGKKVVAITLGSGSTTEAKLKLEQTLHNAGADLIVSKTYWLMRPNDESRLDESNVEVAKDMARMVADSLVKTF